jgi:hypothetical protein
MQLSKPFSDTEKAKIIESLKKSIENVVNKYLVFIKNNVDLKVNYITVSISDDNTVESVSFNYEDVDK